MTLITRLDPKGGMLFNNRRQTIDYEVVDMICKTAGDKLYISPFSEKYFTDKAVRILGDPLKDAPDDAAVFIEDIDFFGYIHRIDKIIVFRWNEVYPADRSLSFDPTEVGFRRLGEIKFSTKVHKDVKKEIYKR